MDFSLNTSKQDTHHDTHALPPHFIQDAYFHYNKVKRVDLDNDIKVVDFGRGLSEEQKGVLKPAGKISAEAIRKACMGFRNIAFGIQDGDETPVQSNVEDVVVYEYQEFPGLQIIPGLLPPETQVLFTSQILHRDLANPNHKINLQSDYDIPYPPLSPSPSNSTTLDSFFLYPQSSPSQILTPKSPSSPHKSLNLSQFLSSKLRWLTLGSQYDWPTRSYTSRKTSTPFPADLSHLVGTLFPHIRPESGVCLLYSPKDYMPVHRDVSEQCSRALVSFSLGCDGIFIVARGEDDGTTETTRPRTVAIQVRSGDCIHLDGEARWAWHAMPRTLAGTCPKWLEDWPVGTSWLKGKGNGVEEKKLEKWRGYMKGKRLNVSCRQVWD